MITLSELIHHLILDPYYAGDDPDIVTLIQNTYKKRSHDRRFGEFNRRYNLWPCKDDDYRHLVYLWIGQGLRAFSDGEVADWKLKRHNSLEFWQQELTFEDRQLKDFLRGENLFLPAYFFPDEPDNTVNKKKLEEIQFESGVEEEVSDKPDNPHPLACFRKMNNLAFKEIKIRIDPERLVLRISARNKETAISFNALGLVRKNEITLNAQGYVLMALANTDFDSNGRGAKRAVSRLSKSLRDAFCTQDQPFQKLKPRFRIYVPKDREAQYKAGKRTVTFDDARPARESTDPTLQFLKNHDPEFNPDEALYSKDP